KVRGARIHLFQQEAGDWAATDLVKTCFLAPEIKRSRLTSQKDGRVLRKSYFSAEGNCVLPSGHGNGVVNDVCRCQPGLNVGVTCSGAKLREPFAAVERNNRRILVACHSRNLRQLVSRVAINSTAIKFVVLEAKRYVIHQCWAESV